MERHITHTHTSDVSDALQKTNMANIRHPPENMAMENHQVFYREIWYIHYFIVVFPFFHVFFIGGVLDFRLDRSDIKIYQPLRSQVRMESSRWLEMCWASWWSLVPRNQGRWPLGRHFVVTGKGRRFERKWCILLTKVSGEMLQSHWLDTEFI